MTQTKEELMKKQLLKSTGWLYKDATISNERYTEKTYASQRLSGINFFKDKCENATVLDIGCAEGLISSQLAKYGASLIHGVEFQLQRLEEAEKLYGDFFKENSISYKYTQENFEDTPLFMERNKSWLRDEYDIILLLGVYHKIKQNEVDKLIGPFVQKAKKYIACRGKYTHFISKYLAKKGFKLCHKHAPGGRTGQIYIFQRKQGK